MLVVISPKKKKSQKLPSDVTPSFSDTLLCFSISFSLSLSASRLSFLLSGVMKPIYILKDLSGEC